MQLRHRTLAAFAAVGAALALPAAAHAKIIDIGTIAGISMPAPSCPSSPCLAVTRTAGYQAKIGSTKEPMVAPRDGRIVGWTITLSKPGKKQISYFTDTGQGKLGLGEAQAGIAVLKPGKKSFGRSVAVSPVIKLTPYFGTTTQFVLANSIAVKKGQIVALNVPTWAPALAVNLAKDTSWRAARVKTKCNDNVTATSQTLGSLAQYSCLYQTARLTYTVTMITTPNPKPVAGSLSPSTQTTTTVTPK